MSTFRRNLGVPDVIRSRAEPPQLTFVRLGDLAAPATWTQEENRTTIRFITAGFSAEQLKAVEQLKVRWLPVTLQLGDNGAEGVQRVIGYGCDATSVTFHTATEEN